MDNWNFYMAFSFFRICGILQGVYKRALQGNASASNALEFGPVVPMFAKKAMSLALGKPETQLSVHPVSNETDLSSLQQLYNEESVSYKFLVMMTS